MTDDFSPPQAEVLPSAGSLIAGYRLEDRIGQGGMGVVFLAHDVRLNRRVALKLLVPGLVRDEAFRRRFAGEALAAAAADDPHIIPVFEAGEADGVLFIAMRYVNGGDVLSLVRRDGPLPLWRAAAIISPVASALDTAHGAGLVHRDVKPANMLLDVRPGRPDHVYLSDFGLSKGSLDTSGLTGSGQFIGTLEYMSPEQVEGNPVDGRADQYALACAAFELLAGEPPFRRGQGLAVAFAHLSAPPPLITSKRPGLPAGTDEVFARALAKAPRDRFATCGDFAEALRAALGLPPYDAGSTDDSPQRAQTPAADLPAEPPTLTPAPGPELSERTAPEAGDAPVPQTEPEPDQSPDQSPAPARHQASGWRPGRRGRVIAAAGAALAAAVTIVVIISRGPAPATGRPAPVTAYIANTYGGTVTPVNVATGDARTPIRVGNYPIGIAITPNGRTAYVADVGASYSGNTVTPIDVATGRTGPPIQVGRGPIAIAITPDSKTAYVTNVLSGTVTPISVATGRAGTPIQVGRGPAGIAITPDGRTAYVADAGGGSGDTVTPIDLATGRAGAPILVGPDPIGIAITPDGKTAYVTDADGDAVTPIDLATGQADTPIQVGRHPIAIAITPDGRTAYVVNSLSDTVIPIDLATGRAGTPIRVGNSPEGIAITPNGRTAYVTSNGGGAVTPIDVATGRAGTPIQVGQGPEGIAITP